MIKPASVKSGLKLTEKVFEHLKRKGINAPPNASAFDIVNVDKGGISTKIFSFRNNDNYLVKRLKIDKNNTTGEQNLQVRFYEYLSNIGNNRKLSKVSAFDFDGNNKCKNGTIWDFYHPYKSKSVWFSRHTQSGSVNNFPGTSDYFEDANGFRIKPISIAEFLDTKRMLGHSRFVDEPWTLKQTVTSDIAGTECIRECTVVGVAGRKGITLNHLNPNNAQNYDIEPIKKALNEQIQEQGKDAKVFMLGSVEIDTNSNLQFWALRDIMEKAGVPFSAYKTGDGTIQEFVNMLPRGLEFGKQIRNGLTTPFYMHSSQHIICKGNEIKVANLIIDKELAKGNKNAADMIKKSFSYIDYGD